KIIQFHSNLNGPVVQKHFYMCTNETATQQEIVDQHNNFRRVVKPSASNMLKMTWSQTVADSAQQWVNQCQLTHGPVSSRMVGGMSCGENLFLASKPYSWTEVITAWHSEVQNYHFPTGSTNGRPIGHYTQVVWYSSYQVGCGAAQCGNLYFYGCQYFRAYVCGDLFHYEISQISQSTTFSLFLEGTLKALHPTQRENLVPTNPCPYINKYINCPALKRQGGCGNYFVRTWCPALCECTDKIIPISRK
uniref:ShKT domain-containing protein n=1 Tax=Denticeps clupeoides TaxID=299321 RepID=A0AAY4AN51_9TELE